MDIVHQLQVKAPSATVFQAFATQNGIQGWWSSDSSVGENPGESITLLFHKGEMVIEMNFQLSSLVPGQSVVWTCTNNANPAWIGTSLSFEVVEENGASKFTLAHTGFDPKWDQQPPYTNTVEGWVPFITSFQAYCETGVGQPMA